MLRLPSDFPTRFPLFLLELAFGENWQMENSRINLFIESLPGSLRAYDKNLGVSARLSVQEVLSMSK